jgi:diguanylate cyclase (GGDEF)-like protein
MGPVVPAKTRMVGVTMQLLRGFRPRIPRTARLFPCLLSLLYCAWSPLASALCIVSPNPQLRQLQSLVATDATGALKQIQAKLNDGYGGESASRAHSGELAALYAVQAEAFQILERAAEGRGAASAGLALVPDIHDPLHSELLTAFAENVYDDAGLAAALRSVESARTLQDQDSTAGICLLITRGVLEHRQNRADLAIVSLTQAYRASVAPTTTQTHIAAAAALSPVMRGMGDFAQALVLNQEEVDWDTTHGATLSLSVSRFMRGQILKAMGKYPDAIEEFSQARQLSVALDDQEGVAYADLRICDAHIELHSLEVAQRECTNAARLFAASRDFDSVKETQALQARIDLEQGRPQKALSALNTVLDRHGEDLPPFVVAPMYELRAKANAAVHNYRDAYEDLRDYVQRNTAANEAERRRQTGALRARFETDQQIERNASLKRELTASREETSRQAEQLRWNEMVVVIGLCIIALLMYFLVANSRYRRQLVKLASQDGLTELPNRRRIAELANAALQAARETQRPLTIGVIDMDHFKVINDCCGHATGDFVLKEFARASREALRACDLMGRWGGEEFLLVMPDATLEVASANLQRLRTLVSAIRLPSTAIGMKVSLSAGLAAFDDSAKSLDELIARADGALYTAKDSGRDRVHIADATQRTGSHAIRRLQRQ